MSDDIDTLIDRIGAIWDTQPLRDAIAFLRAERDGARAEVAAGRARERALAEIAMQTEARRAAAESSLARLTAAAQALVDYEQTGGPEYREWDQHYAALKAALKEKP